MSASSLKGQCTRSILVDPRMQWLKASNVWQNAAMRITLYAPVNAIKNLLQRA